MRTKNVQSVSPLKRTLMAGIFLLGSFMLSSYKGLDRSAGTATPAGFNGHYKLNLASLGILTEAQYQWYDVGEFFDNAAGQNSLKVPGMFFPHHDDSSHVDSLHNWNDSSHVDSLHNWDDSLHVDSLHNWDDSSHVDSLHNWDDSSHVDSLHNWDDSSHVDSLHNWEDTIGGDSLYNDSLEACFNYEHDSLSDSDSYHCNAECSEGANDSMYYKWNPGDGDPCDSGVDMMHYSHTYLRNGHYNATLTIWNARENNHRRAHNGNSSSYTLVINVTNLPAGIQSLSGSKNYAVYPNPNNGLFNIAVNSLAGTQHGVITIYNMMGEVVYHANATLVAGSIINNISLAGAASGIYLLQITTPDSSYSTRIAVQK